MSYRLALSDGAPAPAPPERVVSGDTWRLSVLTDRLIRFEWDAEGRFVDERTQVVVERTSPGVPVAGVTIERLVTGGVEIRTPYVHLSYDGEPLESAELSLSLVRDIPSPAHATWRLSESDLHEPFVHGNLGGTARTLDGADGAVPFEAGVLSTEGITVLDDSGSALLTPDGWIAARHRPPAGAPASRDLYFFAHGRDYAAALRDYHALTGPVPLVPRYVLGNWWSRFWRYTEESYLDLVDRFRCDGIPLSVAVVDMDWHLVDIDPEIGSGWTGYTWNRELFPDPARFLRGLHERGLATTLNVHPADGVRRHEEAYPAMARAVGIDPASGVPVTFDISDRAFASAYLEHLHHPLEAQGVDFWWIDWQQGTESGIAGLDPLWLLNHLHYLDSGRDRTGEPGAGEPDGRGERRRRAMTFSRYAGPGSHRYPVGFSGDTITTWASLDFQPFFTATAANIGYPWWSHDIGGHMGGSYDPERAVRWFQLGVFSPVNRMHSVNSPFASKEPWDFGSPAHGVMRRYLRLRHRLVPLLYTAAWDAHTEARAIVRPMYHDYPQMPEAYHVRNQALVGEHLIVAPITAASDPVTELAAVRVWLPEGSWVDLLTGQRYSAGPGGRELWMHRGLEQLPVLARAGAVLPLQTDPLADVRVRPDSLTLTVVPPAAGEQIRSRLVEDDDVSARPVPTRTTFTQRVERDDDGAPVLVLVVAPAHGPDPVVEREVMIDVVGLAGVERVQVRERGSGGERDCGSGWREVPLADTGERADELLAPAFRVPLGRIAWAAGFEVRLRGVRWRERDGAQESLPLLARARIEFAAKERALALLARHSGVDLAQALAATELPADLRQALLERAASR